MELKTLFSPGKIGNVEIKNRIVRSATFANAANADGTVTEEFIKIYTDLAKGGTGLIITGLAAIDEEGKLNSNQAGLYDDSHLEGQKKFVEDIILLITPLKSFRKLFEEAKLFRTTGKFSMDYEPLRNKFITFIFSLMKQGILHRKIEGEELDLYLTKYFSGFPLIIRFQKK